MARKKKELDVPESVCLFNKQEIEYINQTSKSIPYRIDIQTATINVPPDHFDQATENLHIRHLINKFAFVVQATIGAEVIDKSFNPVMRSNQLSEPDSEPKIALPNKGEVWLHGNERWYFKSATDKVFGITFLESLKSDSTKGKDEISELISGGLLVREQR